MKITVVTITGRTVIVEAKPNDKIESLVLKLQNMEKMETIPSDLRITLIAGTVLKNETTLSECGIRDGSTLQSVLRIQKGLQIFIFNVLTNRTFMLNIDLSETIENVKAKITMRENIPEKQQRLDFAGQKLEDHKTLIHYNIENDNTLFLSQKLQIFIIDLESCSDVVTIEAQPTDTVENVKTELQNILSAYMNTNEIGLIFFKGKIHDPKDYYKDSSLNIMLYLFREDLRLFVDETDLQLNSNETKLFTFEVRPSDTFENIYETIRRKRGSGINPWTNKTESRRIYAGQWPCFGRRHGDYAMLLSSIYEKSPFDPLLLKKKGMLIFCEPKKPKKISLDVEPQYTVSKTKSLISDKLDIPLKQMRLSFEHTELNNENTLSYYNIQTNYTLMLNRQEDLQSMRIFIKPGIAGRTFTLDVEPSFTIEQVKILIEMKEGRPVDQQRLFFDDSPLENDLTLFHYGIENEDLLHLRNLLRGC